MKINFSKKTHIFFYIMLIVFSLQVFAINKPCLAKDTNRTNKISILYTTDDGYFAPTIVSMESALQSMSKDTFYDFHLMVNGEFSKTNDLERFKNKNEDKCSITTHDMGDDFKNDWAAVWPPSMYYRLKAASKLDDKIDKCIYVDGDTLIVKDLSEFFNIDLENNYLGGVLDPQIIREFGNNTHCKNSYINSGVALINLKKIRKDDKEQELLQKVKENNSHHLYTLPDQDILNVVFDGKIKLLSLKYNLLVNLFISNSYCSSNEKTYAKTQQNREDVSFKITDKKSTKSGKSCVVINSIPQNYITIAHFAARTFKPWKAGCGVNNEGKNREVWEPLYQKWRKTADSVKQKYDIFIGKKSSEDKSSESKSSLFSNPYVKWGTIVGGSTLLTTAIVGTGIAIKKFYDKKIAKKPVSQLKKANIA